MPPLERAEKPLQFLQNEERAAKPKARGEAVSVSSAAFLEEERA